MADRNRQLVRTWMILVLLRQRRRSLRELAGLLGVTPRTVRRDLEALGEIFPIVSTRDDVDRTAAEAFWSLEPLREWPRHEWAPTECRPVRALGRQPTRLT